MVRGSGEVMFLTGMGEDEGEKADGIVVLAGTGEGDSCSGAGEGVCLAGVGGRTGSSARGSVVDSDIIVRGEACGNQLPTLAC